MTPKEAARIILIDSINRVLDLKPVAWSKDGHTYTAEHWPSKQLWAWKVYGNSIEEYRSAKDIIGELMTAEAVVVIE